MGLSNVYVSQLNTRLETLKRFYVDAYNSIKSANEAGGQGKIPDERDMVDAQFLLKGFAQLCEDLRKEANRAVDILAKVTALSWTTKQMAGLVKDDKVHGQLATGTPDVKMIVKLPKKGTPAYDRICRHFGLVWPVIDAEVFHIHWPAFVEFCSTLLREGKPLPDGLTPADAYPQNEFKFDEDTDFVCDLRKVK